MILLNIKNIINDYAPYNTFEIKIIDKKIKIYYYEKISYFSSKKITILKDDNVVDIIGDNLVIESMFEESIIIKGNIKSIMLGNKDE